MMSFIKPLIIVVIAGTWSLSAFADIGKVYHPYVEPLEREIEFMATRSLDDMDQHKTDYTLAYGQTLRENVFLELSVRGSESDQEILDVESFELEGLFQLSEQGAGPVDYGVLIEAERESAKNISEIGGTLVLEGELGPTSLALNLGMAYEFGGGIDNEYDRFMRLQWRYRLQPGFQPAFEIHMDEYDKAAGPAAVGSLRLGNKQKLKWELGWLFALEEETPASLLKAVLEYEF